jgi:hypothetical protein
MKIVRHSEEHPLGVQRRHDRGQGRHAGRDRHRDGHHVADEQRRGGQHAAHAAQVVAGHDVAARAVRVRPDRLPVRERDDGQHHGDQQRQRQRESERAGAGQRQHPHDLLGPVGRRADVVAREDRERLDLRQALVLLALGADRAADEPRAERAQPGLPPPPLEDRAFGGDQLSLVAAQEGVLERPDDAHVGVPWPLAAAPLADLEQRIYPAILVGRLRSGHGGERYTAAARAVRRARRVSVGRSSPGSASVARCEATPSDRRPAARRS